MSKITVIGHKNPDVDSILSGYLLTSYLRYKKYDIDYVIPDKSVDEEASTILKLYSVDVNNFTSEISSDSKLILVDHHETDFDNEVVAVIDHHPTIKSFNYKVYINERASSTTKHIYDIVNEECPGYISRRFMELVLLGMAIDTISFKSSKALPGDKEWFIDMCNEYNIDADKILKEGFCLTNLENIEKAILNGVKSYNYFGNLIKATYIQVYKKDEDIISEMLNLLKEEVTKNSLYMWVFMVVDLKDVSTRVYKIYKDKIEIDNYNFIASRGSEVMPKIEKDISEKYN